MQRCLSKGWSEYEFRDLYKNQLPEKEKNWLKEFSVKADIKTLIVRYLPHLHTTT